jgi:adenylate kinase
LNYPTWHGDHVFLGGIVGKVIYVTGAPASGKSTTTQLLLKKVAGTELWEYGARLTDYLRSKGIDLADQATLRAMSSKVAVAAAVKELDDLLIRFVAENRDRSHVLIDSHPVTKEAYGFRITAFRDEQIKALAPDEIWFFYTMPEVAAERIRSNPQGRPLIGIEVARMHTNLQASVAATYGIAAGCAVYMFDSDRDQDGFVAELQNRLGN